jgi:hypothetical protein
MSTAETSNVLRFPNTRKRPYPSCYVPRDELPANAVRLEVGPFKKPEPLSAAGLHWLVTAHLATARFARQRRLHDKLDKWLSELPDDDPRAEGVVNAKSFLLRMPCREEHD